MAADFTCQAIDPKNPTGPKIEVIFPGDLTERCYKYSPVRYRNLIAAKFVLDYTERIYFGVREFNEGGWCYTARPREWYIREQVVVPFPEDLVYAVYLNPNMRVYEWRAERVGQDDPFAPADWQERYRGLTWKSTF